MDNKDLRNAPRLPVRIPLRVRLIKSPIDEKLDSELHNGNNVMSNMSRTGFFLSTKNYFEVNSVIEVEFPMEQFDEVIKAEAEVVRANHQNFPNHGRYEYGLRYVSMHPHFREVLNKFFNLMGG
jgi:c-di-GMP-binding flagellar brake protein YcgR